MTYSIEDDKARGLSEVLINGILYRIHDGAQESDRAALVDQLVQMKRERDDARAFLDEAVAGAKESASAECERLRKSEAEWKYWRSTAVKACDRAEARLATAEGLAREWREKVGITDEWIDDFCERMDAALARDQPAAPTRAQMPGDWSDADCNDLRKPLPTAPARTEDAVFETQGRSWPAGTHPASRFQGWPPFDQPSAPWRCRKCRGDHAASEACQPCPCGDWSPAGPSRPGHPQGWCQPAAPDRTEGEQAVLDAMAEADVEEPSLRDLLPAVRAELARRGLT